jgi:aryl-alcohol dehydrogenase-like predicted oxidoreductase
MTVMPIQHLLACGPEPEINIVGGRLRPHAGTTLMQYAVLGRTGLEVSRICLGCLSFGEPERGVHGWTLGEDASRPLIRQAIELGINFFDTANSYSDGSSEEIVGRALRDFARREELVIATKVQQRMRSGPNGMGLSRKAIFTEIDNSLRRLGTDHVDLYQIHRADPAVPIEETLAALNDVVRAGKALHIGACSMPAWQFCKAIHISRQHGWAEFATMQNHMNLVYREEEREMLPLCTDQNIAVLPWSPLAKGLLTHTWGETTDREAIDAFAAKYYAAARSNDETVVAALSALSARRKVPHAQLALAWLLQKPTVASPIVGVSQSSHLLDAVASLDIALDADEVEALQAPYAPHAVSGY